MALTPEMPKLTFFHSWVDRLKKRHAIKAYTRHGEVAFVVVIEEGCKEMDQLFALIESYHPNDAFNMDETNLFYRLELSSRTLASKQLYGKKLQQERIALITNMICTLKFPPFVINKPYKPHTFIGTNITNPKNLGNIWRADAKAWMTLL